jgi:hypothetical protein
LRTVGEHRAEGVVDELGEGEGGRHWQLTHREGTLFSPTWRIFSFV